MKWNWLAYLILGLVLLIEIPRFYGTYAEIDPLILGLPLTAVGTGIALPLGAGYVFHMWWTAQHNRKHRDWLLVAFGVLLLLEGVILVPWGMAQLQDATLAQVVGSGLWAVAWVTVVMLSPFVTVGAVVMALSFQKGSTRKATQTAETETEASAVTTQALPFETKTEHVLWLAGHNPEWDNATLAQKAGCSASTVTRALASRNGRE